MVGGYIGFIKAGVVFVSRELHGFLCSAARVPCLWLHWDCRVLSTGILGTPEHRWILSFSEHVRSSVIVRVWVCVMYGCKHTCHSTHVQVIEQLLWSRFSFSTFTWVLGIQLRVPCQAYMPSAFIVLPSPRIHLVGPWLTNTFWSQQTGYTPDQLSVISHHLFILRVKTMPCV